MKKMMYGLLFFSISLIYSENVGVFKRVYSFFFDPWNRAKKLYDLEKIISPAINFVYDNIGPVEKYFKRISSIQLQDDSVACKLINEGFLTPTEAEKKSLRLWTFHILMLLQHVDNQLIVPKDISEKHKASPLWRSMYNCLYLNYEKFFLRNTYQPLLVWFDNLFVASGQEEHSLVSQIDPSMLMIFRNNAYIPITTISAAYADVQKRSGIDFKPKLSFFEALMVLAGGVAFLSWVVQNDRGW